MSMEWEKPRTLLTQKDPPRKPVKRNGKIRNAVSDASEAALNGLVSTVDEIDSFARIFGGMFTR